MNLFSCLLFPLDPSVRRAVELDVATGETAGDVETTREANPIREITFGSDEQFMTRGFLN